MNYTTAIVQLPLVKEAATDPVRSPQVLTVNSKNRLINRHMITLGLVDASLVHPREVFRPAILDGAAAVMLVHNHPSGDAEHRSMRENGIVDFN